MYNDTLENSRQLPPRLYLSDFWQRELEYSSDLLGHAMLSNEAIKAKVIIIIIKLIIITIIVIIKNEHNPRQSST